MSVIERKINESYFYLHKQHLLSRIFFNTTFWNYNI
jgi:hypothetical protein